MNDRYLKYFKNKELVKKVEAEGTHFDPSIFDIMNGYDSDDSEDSDFLKNTRKLIKKIKDVKEIRFTCDAIENIKTNKFWKNDYQDYSLTFNPPIKMTDALVAVEDFLNKEWTLKMTAPELIPPETEYNFNVIGLNNDVNTTKINTLILGDHLHGIYFEGIESLGDGIYEINHGT